jgi:hypothetical protein
MTLRSRVVLAWWVAALVTLGCVGTPLPEPPNLASDLLAVEPMRCNEPCPDGGSYRIFGGPGTVTPGASVIITELDTGDAPNVAPPTPDGAFDITIRTVAGGELRIEADRDGLRSPPFYMVADPVATVPVPAPRPLADCFVVTPLERDVAISTTTTVVIDNRCAEALTILRTAFRADPTAWRVIAGEVIAGTPLLLDPGATHELEISPAGVLDEDLLLIEASTATVTFDRRVVRMLTH